MTCFMSEMVIIHVMAIGNKYFLAEIRKEASNNTSFQYRDLEASYNTHLYSRKQEQVKLKSPFDLSWLNF